MPFHNIFRVNPTSSSFPRFLNFWSGEDDGTGTGSSAPQYAFVTGRAVTVVAGTIARATVPGSSGLRVQALNGTGSGIGEFGSATGSNLDIGAAATDAYADIGGTWQAASNAAAPLSETVCLGFFDIGSGSTSDDNNICLLYEDATDPSINLYGFGDHEFNLLNGAGTNDRFTTFGISDAVSATESDVQMPWPSTGTFQYVSMVYAVGTGTGDVTLALRINGDDTAVSFTLSDTSGAKTFTHNSALSVMVNAGDLVSWRLNNASGTPSFLCVLLCGFVRD